MQPPFDLNLMNPKFRDSRELFAKAEAARLSKQSNSKIRSQWPGLRNVRKAWKILTERVFGRLVGLHS